MVGMAPPHSVFPLKTPLSGPTGARFSFLPAVLGPTGDVYHGDTAGTPQDSPGQGQTHGRAVGGARAPRHRRGPQPSGGGPEPQAVPEGRDALRRDLDTLYERASSQASVPPALSPVAKGHGKGGATRWTRAASPHPRGCHFVGNAFPGGHAWSLMHVLLSPEGHPCVSKVRLRTQRGAFWASPRPGLHA